MAFDHQDWTPVVFHKPKTTAADVKSKEAIKHAQRTGANVETLSKDHNREEKDRARKLENETAVLPKLSLAMRKIMTDARTKKNITRDQLAQQLNVKPKVVSDLETGQVVSDPSILVKVRRILGTPELKFG